MRLHSLLAVLSLCILGTAHAAILTPDLSDLNSLPLHSLAAPLVSKAISTAAPKTQPLQFAVSLDLPLTLNDGQWQRIGDLWRWRTRIQSQGAQSLNFTFSKFRMPDGASLWVYDAAGNLVQGPYTHANETPEGKLWTPVIMGGDAVIEVHVPASQRDALQLQLGQVNHGFRVFEKQSIPGFPSNAGACERDVVCQPEAGAWPNEIRSVGLITIGGTAACSGQMINNTSQNDDPLFLTANHCLIDQTGGGPASSVVVYWNYQNSTCQGSRNGDITHNQTGSTTVAQDQPSDFTLVRLASKPNAAYSVFYSGWNVQGTLPTAGAVIHHPQANEKKISLTSSGSPATIILCDSPLLGGACSPLSPSRTVSAWAVTYSSGVTEPGSSGSGLRDGNHYLVGQLSGGNSSCSNTGGTDYYGRFDLAYANSSALRSAIGNSSTLCGKDQGAASCQTISGSSTVVQSSSAAASKSGGGTLNPLLLLGLLGMGALRRHKTQS